MTPTSSIGKEGLYDIYPLWHIPFWQTSAFYVSVTTIIFMVLISISIWAIMRYKQRTKLPLPYWQQALTELTLLREKKYITKSDGKQCYFALTSIMKRYLTDRYALDISAKTDHELIHNLQSHKLIPEKIYNYVYEVCNGCELIKFANQEALQEQISKHIDVCTKIIFETRTQENKTV